MTLRNAFENLAVESKQDEIITVLENLRTSGIDPTNSSQAALGNGGVFPGGFVDTQDYQSALVFAFSDVPLASMRIYWSSDGVNTRSGLLGFSSITGTLTSGFYVYLSVLTTFVDRYMRVEIVNGATPTSTFEADTWLYAGGFPGSFGGLTSTLSNISSALLTRSVIAGTSPDGTFLNAAQGGTKTLSPVPTLLGSGGVYTSDVIDTEQFPTLLMLITADQPSALNGFRFEWADTADFTTLLSASTYSFRTGDIANGLLVPARTRARYLRIKYTNGSNAQGRFTLSMRMNPIPLVREVSLVSMSIGQTGQQDVTVAASRVASNALPNRKSFRLKNLSSSARPLFYGFTGGVTVTNGDALAAGESVDLDIDEFVEVYVLTTSTQGAGVRCAWTEIGVA